jgi:cytochrome c553
MLAAALVASAATAPNVHAEGSADAGQRLAYTCLGCHGIEGYRNAYPSYRVPKLGGQKRAYLEASLAAYRAGSRPHPTMQAQGSDLSDQDIEDLAAYFAGAEVERDYVTPDDFAGLVAANTCLACHGAESDGVVPTPPTLSGQHESYLAHALEQYKSAARGGTLMSGFAGALSETDIQRIAAFYSRRDGLRTPGRDQ